MARKPTTGLLAAAALLSMITTADAVDAVALFGGQTIPIANARAENGDLWVTPGELPKICGFELKPEGACLAEICVPVDQAKDSAIYARKDGQPYLNASELARKINQAVAADEANAVWSFGEVPANMNGYLKSAVAPDFELKDRKGNAVNLSDFRGKKVVLVTWASW